MGTVTHTLNGTKFTFNQKTGAVLSLFNEGCGEIIQNGRGLIDIAWPKKYEFEILRVSPTGKHGGAPVSINAQNGKIVLSYPLLAQNTVTPELPALAGGVAAEITLAACEDGKSIALTCRVKNNSETPVRQVLFPDLSGLQPVTGRENTRFTGLRAYTTPFTELDDEACKKNPSYVSASPIPLFYAEKPSLCGKFYPANRHLQMDIRVGRYYDYGGLRGGFSMFCRHWGFGPDRPGEMGAQDVVWVKLDNLAQSLRIANVHDITLEKGQEYTSPVYILTPHPGGWAQGIAPYKKWVDENKRRAVEPPRRVKEMLGFRTIWATEMYPDDPDAAIWAYDEYPAVAEDMLEHGLDTLNVWGMFEEILPLCGERFHQPQGGFEAAKRAVDKLRAMGVRVESFVSWVPIWEMMRERYGLEKTASAEQGWSENLKGVPNFRTPYMERYRCASLAHHKSELWMRDVEEGLRFLRDELGTPDICWDVYNFQQKVLHDLLSAFRRETAAMHPGASFSAETTNSFEADIDHIDYTWNWIPRGADRRQDISPYLHVVETTRLQENIDCDPLYLKYSFISNAMMNIYPSLPENINGSALIRDVPELSKALKQCSRLRKKFMKYFANGKPLGDCVLANDCEDARVMAYELDSSILLLAVKYNGGDARIEYDLSPFTRRGHLTAALTGEDGQEIGRSTVPVKGTYVLSGAKHSLFAVEFTE